MSDVQNTTAPMAEATEPTTALPTAQPDTTAAADHAALVEEAQKPMVNGEPAVESSSEPAAPVAAAEEKKDEVAPAATEEAEKAVEPVTQGQLGYKGPGLLK